MTDPKRRARHQSSPLPFPVVVPFVESLGIELHAYGEGRTELRVDLDAGHLNAWEVAHGGVLMTLLDVAMAMAARSATGHGGGVATIEMKTSFLRPAQHRLRAEGRLLHKTATLVFCEAAVHDAEDRLCATASGTFKVLRGLVRRPPPQGCDTSADATPDPAPSAHPTAKDDPP